ncbi:MAG TPA: outer membrane protein assembly factor BamA, partial [Candidatus Limnocylindrales bacterium]|nr:outer membrane protein assembly factor BamA [Candidatus Limnocylindrales bacterium]
IAPMIPTGRVSLSIFFALLALALAAPVPAQTPPSTQPPIAVKDLAVQGNRRVQEAVILGRVTTRVGSAFSPTRLAEDIRGVFALGFFDDVQVKVEDFEGGVKVTLTVTERPFVRDIQFAGNKKVDTAALLEKIDLKLGSVYNPVEVNRAAEKIKEHYEEEGYFEVGVTPDAEKLPDGDVQVVFRIAEGRRITIDEIVVEGAQGLKPKQVKGIMLVQERQYWVLRGTLQRQKLDEDLDRITQFYADHGYIQARVESATTQVDRNRARVTIRIAVGAGPQFKVGGVDVTGNQVLPVEEIRRRIKLATGDVFSRSKLRDSVKAIQDLYGVIGRASVDVNPNTIQDSANRLVNITFEINEGPEVFVERINIAGNTRSQEKILRREIPMNEGDLFTTAKLVRARQKLTNLGYFESVRATTTPGSTKDKIVVNIEVTEKPTGLFSIGGGYSSSDGVLGSVDLSQRNFLGRGWEVFLRLRAGESTQQGTIGFTEPWLFDRPLAAGFDIYNNRHVYSEYTVNSLGGDIRFGHPIGDYSRWNAIYRISEDRISDVPDNASTSLIEERGSRLTSLVGGSVSRDTRDSVFEPTRGTTLSIGLDVAGVGFGSRFYRTVGSATYFHPLWLDHVIGFRLSAGYSAGWDDEPVPLFERFFLGGPNSIRSRKTRQISPVDQSGTRIGGNSQVLANVEYVIPLFFGIRAAMFYDIGNVYGPDIAGSTPFDLTELRHAIGVGFRWASPFGPLRVDYGVNVDRKKGESFGQFHFSVGSPF